MAKERQQTYYIEILPDGDPAYTNRVLASNIGEENAEEVLCSDGVIRPMWRCPQAIAIKLWNSRHDWKRLGFRIRVWQQEGKGQVRIASGHHKNPRFPSGRPERKKANK